MAIVEKWLLYGWWYKSDYRLEQKSDWCREGVFIVKPGQAYPPRFY